MEKMYAAKEVGKSLTAQEKALYALGLTEEEVRDVIESDKRIDKGEKLFELDPELAKGAKKARQAERKVSTTAVKREKKPKPEKEELCSVMMGGLSTLGIADFDIANKEREFSFEHNGVKYKVVLSCPRK